MPELRKDPIIDRWVIISSERGQRPVFLAEQAEPPKPGAICPLCPGNESMTPPEVFAIRPVSVSSPPNSPNWLLRVVPNKFPALRIEGDLNKQGVGLYDKMNGVGAHEVIVETPIHSQTLSSMDVPSVQNVFLAYQERTTDLLRDKRFKFIMIFKNQGSMAGASLAHSHSQLIALPIIPKRLSEEITGALSYYKYRDRCVFCDIIAQESEERQRIIYENDHFIAISPFASRFPFETWILPKRHEESFLYSGADNYYSVADALLTILKKHEKILNSPPYNYMIHTTPVELTNAPYYHWHIEVIPRLTKLAGFEWGTGFYINPTPPEEATIFLQEADV
ncbi:MAG: Galactose-1-phosphate uridylyltransferase [Syntrophorhabdaceae bacterium PtaU1.Bin034]|jgi:UDPglucose--hexose-1-phosphate uridylyltransferase|nr:MAG: Galactose-1-phosphate uridylyltransferase [Syntrophorhabdaceae bacterium PtaU1.Bin034]